MENPLVAVDLGQGVEDAFRSVTVFVPKLLGFLAILVIGYFVAKVIGRVANAALERVGFDRAVERGGIKKALSRSDYDASDILGKVIFYALFLLVLQLAFGVFGPNPVSQLLNGVIAYLPKVIAAIIIIVVAAAIAAAAKGLIENSLGGLSYGRPLAVTASAAILAVGVFAALSQLQIAPEIVTGLFYALLAVVAGSAIIAIGGGGIQPMRSRWEQALNRIEQEAPQAREHMRSQRQDDQRRQHNGHEQAPTERQPLPAQQPPQAHETDEVEYLELEEAPPPAPVPAPSPATAPAGRRGDRPRRAPLRPRGERPSDRR
ncbi:MAG TPA: hypothetical protein VGV63_09955 [Acidimicrobiales bacterium]|nr:hypothetical protein [Acidimicrobiales bacterium]